MAGSNIQILEAPEQDARQEKRKSGQHSLKAMSAHNRN